ncbi:hypothetical protein AYO50_00180 [Acidobacteria bacterium SCGC AG-212-P17]|nr:hypothetical protein AYO50_00180 [Acidobacteria bacterium SCGC AG-212-P17]
MLLGSSLWQMSFGESAYEPLIYIFCMMAGVLVMLPLLVYLFTLWTSRRDNLLSVLKADSLKIYYEQFYPQIAIQADVCKQFKAHFNRLYGRRNYIFPIILLGILTALAVYAGIETLLVWNHMAAPTARALPGIAAAAMAGAFLWVVSDEFDRFRKRDVTIHDVYGYVYRILIAVPFGWALAPLMRDSMGVPLAFFLGAFPTRTLFTISRRLGAQKLGLADEPSTGSAELERLQCVDKPSSERYLDEGISSIVQLAYSDPIDLAIRTNFDFNYVIDCVSQSLLWIYFQDEVRNLYKLSLRGAQEVGNLVEDYKKGDLNAKQDVKDVADQLKISEMSLLVALDQVAEDPYTKFIRKIWG